MSRVSTKSIGKAQIEIKIERNIVKERQVIREGRMPLASA
jgi:hypothetical protein